MLFLSIKRILYLSFHSKHALIRPLGCVRFCSNNIKNEIRLQIGENAKVGAPKKPTLRFTDGSKSRRTIGPFGWLLLFVPAVTFCLGTWQVRRKAWKEHLIEELHRRRDAQPVGLPNNLDNLGSLEYYPVHVRGHFLHDRQMFLGPRSLLVKGAAASEGSTGLVSRKGGGGYLLVTPFQLEGRKEMILVNRGWVPDTCVKSTALRKHIDDASASTTTDVIGLLRLSEKRPPFMPHQQSTTRSRDRSPLFLYRDVAQMALLAGDGCAQVYLDATDDHLLASRRESNAAIAPLANQTRVTLRNEHLGYVVTWYGLSAATGLLWYRHFLIKR